MEKHLHMLLYKLLLKKNNNKSKSNYHVFCCYKYCLLDFNHTSNFNDERRAIL